ncbi:MAG: TIGR00730 family Rossman fold protein [Pseudobdellovibrio sp.]|nr:TIGR00730 family Rossman fold protein [Pseudobdellovibrio sp.]
MKSICIYCGSRTGNYPDLMPMAYKVGEQVAKAGHTVVYGGANVGLMGQVADGALSKGGRVLGVIPQLIFDFEVAHEGITELHQVDNMHQRKLKMMELSDAFIALPGGFGTMDELNEIITWRQIKLHDKPIAILNYNGYYDHYLEFLKVSVKAGLISQAHLDMLIVSDSIETVLAQL